jgi:hypothetical protein
VVELARRGEAALAAASVAASLAAGLLLVHVVTALTRRVRVR